MWVSIEPELWPTCKPWFPGPANVVVVVMLGRAIVRASEQAAQCGEPRAGSRAAALVHEAGTGTARLALQLN
jgi:hypothetical protein